MADHPTRAGRRPDHAAVASSLPAGATYFLGIGINDYQYWPRLQNAVKDVQTIADLLVGDYGLPAEHTRLLLNAQATEANIVDAFESLTREVQQGDSVLIYYAGHGHLNERGRGFWVPVDAPKGQVVRYIRNSTIKDYIGDIPSLHTLLISDSCFSGSLFSSGVSRSSELAAEELACLPSRWAICSGRHDEVVADGPRAGHSPFAESILEVLGGNLRPLITTGFLVQQVIEQTRANYDQLPDGGPLQGVGHKRGQFVFRQQRGRGASRLWERIQGLGEATLPQLKVKKDLLRQYCQEYPKGENYREALALGRRLEHKRQFLDAYDSEFGLLALLEQKTPYQSEIQTRLNELRKLAAAESIIEHPVRRVATQTPSQGAETFPPPKAATPRPPGAASAIRDHTISFWKYAGLVLLVTLLFRLLLSALIGWTPYGVGMDILYTLILPGAVILHYFRRFQSWRSAWRLALVALVGYLLYYSWLGLGWYENIVLMLSRLLIGLSAIVPTLVMALITGVKIQFTGTRGDSQRKVVASQVGDRPDSELAPSPHHRSLFWQYALWCVLAVGVSAYILIYNKIEQLDTVVVIILFTLLLGGPVVLVWRYGQRSLSPRRCFILSFLSCATFIIVGRMVDGSAVNMGEALLYLLFSVIFFVPAWIGIWWKKRKIRQQSPR